MRSDLEALLREIQTRVVSLKKQKEGLDNAIQSKNLRLLALEDQVKVLQDQLHEKEHQIKILKLAKKVAGEKSADTQGVKRQISELVNEIDRCIALLNG
jgi:predicted  nucleic acid-binding Zn-ribbon protein